MVVSLFSTVINNKILGLLESLNMEMRECLTTMRQSFNSSQSIQKEEVEQINSAFDLQRLEDELHSNEKFTKMVRTPSI